MRPRGIWIAVVVAALPVLNSCLGPRPVVESSRLLPRSGSNPIEVEVMVRNDGGGDGQASVMAKLTDKESGRVFRGELKVTLSGHETVIVRVPIDAPGGDYRTEVKALYPPE